jgi:1-acyl-sn-glycerol-3-phosphate acyltransferase
LVRALPAVPEAFTVAASGNTDIAHPDSDGFGREEASMRAIPIFLLLLLFKLACRLFYCFDVERVGVVPPDPWKHLRIIAVLNHTSLYEPIFATLLPPRVLWQLAQSGVVPIASKTMNRRGTGWVFRVVGRRVISVSRKRDFSWQEVLRYCCGPDAITVIFPEGRMLRRTGLDSDGRPMTVRSGIADLLAGIPSGRMLLAYSGGLHHVAAPGDRVPRLFKRIAIRLEVLDIPAYREALGGTRDLDTFRRRVVEDLTLRRNRHCPITGPTIPQWAA